MWHSRCVVIVFMFLLGSIIGSFLNVCIVRIPEEFSIVLPASRCPKCETPIHWYDNVPVFAWFWLGGKCRACRVPISPMYPLVEAATGLLFVACYLKFGLSPNTAKWLVFTSLLIVLTITDLRVRMLPDLVNWPGFAAGLVCSAVVPPNDRIAEWLSLRLLHMHPSSHILGLMDGLFGAAFGSLGFWAFGTIFSRVLGRQAFGLGDVKMLAVIGAFMGTQGLFLTVLLGSLIGSIVGIGIILGLYLTGWKRRVAERATKRGIGKLSRLRWKLVKRYELPFGTYLGIGAMVAVYFGPQLLARWAELFQFV